SYRGSTTVAGSCSHSVPFARFSAAGNGTGMPEEMADFGDDPFDLTGVQLRVQRKGNDLVRQLFGNRQGAGKLPEGRLLMVGNVMDPANDAICAQAGI